jgi:hypothetical protein
MTKKIVFPEYTVYDNFILNVNEILNLVKNKYNNLFLSRSIKESYTPTKENPNGGDALNITSNYTDLYHSIFKTIDKDLITHYPNEITLYRYNIGSFLPKHSDKLLSDDTITDLVFLQSTKNHFKVYTSQYPNGYLIDEIPGRRVIIPENLSHEITPIEKDEEIRYTLKMTWYNNQYNKYNLWSKR